MRMIIKQVLFFLLISLNVTAQNGKFTFTIPSSINTSAGVFKSDGTLVRTLWNNVRYPSGTHSELWDGKDDLGVQIKSPDAIYQVRVLTNNVQYNWQGTIGNSSDFMTGPSKHRGYYDCMRGLAFGPTYGYFCTGYSEQSPAMGKFNIATPNQKINPFFSPSTSTPDIDYVATDGIKVYWGAFDANNSTNTFVFGTNVSDDSEVVFARGVPTSVTYIRTFPSAISNLRQNNSLITGLAVQKTGSYLFVARSGLNQLQVLDKTTGAVIKILSYSKPRSICVDANDALWMITGTNTVANYAVNANGTLSSAAITLPGLLDPLATQVSTDGNLITVADGSTSQQVKFFNSSTGAPVNTLGSAGGYATDATVNDNKFYFSDRNGNRLPFIAYQPNGTFWVNDPGNFRVQHYNTNRTFINRVMSMGASYAVYVDKNNINKVFRNFLEFDVDYSVQTLTGSSGWTLKRNWGATTSSAIYNSLQYGPTYITTLSNSRTYGLINRGLGCEVVEFGQNNQLRFTGVLTNDTKKIICSDGSLQEYTTAGSTAVFNRYPLTGFDGSGNPIWSSTPEVLATAKIDNVAGNPVIFPKNQVFTTTTNKIVLYNYHAALPSNYNVFPTGSTPAFHLGLMQRGTKDTFLFQTEKSTTTSYQGKFPEAGWFDIGNGVSDGAAGNVNIIDRNIITSYHGEFWKGAQTNKYNHYYDDGLAIGQFGTTRQEIGGYGVPAAAQMAGNALTPTLVKDGNGDLYLWHGDESDHGGVHRWKISGLNTIAEQVISIPFPSAVVSTINYVDLMAGLPFSQVLKNNTAGWTRNPVNDKLVNGNTDNWLVSTNALKFDKEKGIDLYIRFAQPAKQNYNVSRDLGTNNVTKSWKIIGNISFTAVNGHTNGRSNDAFLEVLDANGKVLTTFYAISDFSKKNSILTQVFGNTVPVYAITENTGSIAGSTMMGNLTPFDISIANGIVTFNYAGYIQTTTILDPTGNWRTPKTLRIKFVSAGSAQNYNVRYDVSDLKFYKDFSPANFVNQAPVANAGKDIQIVLPANTATLQGDGTDPDGTIISYDWVKLSGPAAGVLTSPNTANATIISLVPGVYHYQLTVSDNNGLSTKDTVKVTVTTPAPNLKPIANAGLDGVITLPTNSITLIGFGTDSDGKIISYSWSKIAGPLSGVMVAPNASTSLVNNLVQGIYEFELTVTDNNGANGKDTVQYTVNIAPVPDAGTDTTITMPLNIIQLNGSGSDADGKISSYSWIKISGPLTGTIASAAKSTTMVYNLVAGVYNFAVTVVDDDGASGIDTIQVIVNTAPVATAGINKIISLPVNTIALTGGGTDADGKIISYAWAKISGPLSAKINTPNAATTIVDNLVQGVYTFALTVTDNSGAFGKATVQITVNAPPVANAGIVKPLILPVNSTTLAGIGTDADGTIKSCMWRKVSGPAAALITRPNVINTPLKNLVLGIYTFELTVTDNNGAIGKDTAQVIVTSPPIADAGLYKTITLPLNNTTLSGSGVDADGSISSYAWLKIFGPSSGTIVSPNAATTVVSGLTRGVFRYQLTVTDNNGAIAKDIVQIIVNAPPVVNAGIDKLISLPVSTITLSGSGSDLEGPITNYSWVKISGPSAGTIKTAGAASTVINNLTQGIYLFELTVTDNSGAISKDTTQVRVNTPPVANAGTSQIITSPANSVTLNGFGTDADGTINTYSWAKISGPGFGTIMSANAPTTQVNNLTIRGTYVYELTVTDNIGAKGKDTVQVIVNLAINKPPVSNAGADIILTLPINFATIVGSGVDFDGTVSSYKWTKIAGPSAGRIATQAFFPIITVNNLAQGVYQFELSVKDNTGAIANDTVQVTINTISLGRSANNNTIQTAIDKDSVNKSQGREIPNPLLLFVNSLRVYPNPANNFTNLSITATEKNQKVNISVYNFLGALVNSTQVIMVNNNTLYKLNTSGLNNGIYSIVVTFSDGKRINYKLVKNAE